MTLELSTLGSDSQHTRATERLEAPRPKTALFSRLLAAAALQVLEARGAIQTNERTVVLLTGTGIKSTQFMTDLYSAA